MNRRNMKRAIRRIAAGGLPAMALAGSLAVGAGTGWAAADAGQTPVATVKKIENALLKSMHAGHRHEDYQARYELIAPVVRQMFDWPFTARTVMGAYWSRLDDSQQQKLSQALFQCTAATYAANFDDYTGETFHIRSTGQNEAAGASPYRLVRSEFTESDGTRHQFTYMLRKQHAGWTVINVIADGVSNLALDRGQFSEIMEREGFGTLLQHIHDTIDDIRTTGNGQC